MDSGNQLFGTLAALGSAASWAVGAILFKRVGDEMSSSGMTLAKAVVSTVLLGLMVWALGFEAMSSRTLWILALSGVVGIAIGDIFFFKALKNLGPVSLLVLMVLGQVLMILVGVFWFHERPGIPTWAGIGCILFGVTVTMSADIGSDSSKSSVRGLAFGLGFVLCMVAGLTITKEALLDDTGAMQATFVRMAAGAVVVLIGGLVGGQVGGWITPLMRGPFLANFLLAVCVVTFGGFWLSMYALKHLDVAVANTLNSTEPIFVIPLAYFVLKERITSRSVAGALSVVAGVALIFLNSPIKPTS